jgi:hypothetical protein
VACTYSPDLATAKDRVRLRIGDIGPWTGSPPDQTGCLRPDETINALITASGEDGATAELALSLATQYAQQPDSMSADGASVSWRSRVDTWRALATAAGDAAAAGGTGSSRTATVSRAASRGDQTTAEYYRPPWWTPTPMNGGNP